MPSSEQKKFSCSSVACNFIFQEFYSGSQMNVHHSAFVHKWKNKASYAYKGSEQETEAKE